MKFVIPAGLSRVDLSAVALAKEVQLFVILHLITDR
jgi:hypothetical protein